MVVILFYEQIIVLFDDKIFPANKFGCLKFIEEIVIDIRALFDEFELCSVAMSHASIKFSLEKKGDQKPVNAYHAIVRAFIEEKDDRDDDCEGSLEDHVHVSKQIEDQFQIDVLELDQFRVWYAISTLFGHSERFGYEFAGESAFYFDGEFVKQSFGVF